MKSVEKLDDLPNEILFKIFDFIPNRWNLSLVSWDFYEIVCEIEKNQFCFKLIDLDDDDKYESIMSSKRSFNSAKLVNFRNPHHHVIERLREILDKFSLSIHRLELASSILQEDEVLSLLNILQKVEEIMFYDVEFVGSESDKNLQFNHLKKFDFHLCNVKIPNVILKLPLNVLNSLTIENCILKKEKLHEIFENQRNIQELQFDPYYVSPASMDHLKLKKMKLMCNRNVSSILKNQPDLTSLDLSRAHIGDNEFLEVCTLHKIESLKLWIDRVSSEILGNISSLKTLTDFSINYDRLEVEYMRNLTRIKIPHLRKLKIKFPRLKILPNNFIEMSMYLPHLKHLNISNQSVGVLGVLIGSFKNLETLIIGCDSDSPEVVDFPVGKVHHDKLKELCIYSSFANLKYLKCSTTILEIINKSLTKLEKLKFSNVIALNSQQVQQVLADHESFTHLSVSNPKSDEISFDENFVQLIQDFGKNLKYFQLRGVEIPVHKKILEKNFCGQFSYVNIKPWRNQIVLRNCKWEHADD